MHWLQTLDVGLFRWINSGLINPLFDAVMPFVSGNAFFYPALAIAAALLLWKGRARALICVFILVLAVALSDGLICRTMKEALGRARPFLVLPEVHCLVGKSHSSSMPSGHAANWFAATMVAFIYYRRSLWFVLPVALVVSFSRVYNGVHYPSDVLVGAIVGAGSAAGLVSLLNTFWGWAGQKWFPLWRAAMPSLLYLSPRNPSTEAEEAEPPRPASSPEAPHVALDQHWLRLGYTFLAVLLIARLLYISSHVIQLGEDETYQWLWSKHLALSYYSKPPLIAYTQFIGTALWGDTAFGVRFFSPIISALLGLLVLRFIAREVNARAAFLLLLIITATPLMALGGVLMTIDPLSVLFWTAATLAGWHAVQPAGKTVPWLWVGLWMGLGFLSKYTELFQWLCWVVFFALWPPARNHLRRPGPYLALLVNVLCAVPVLIWNYQNNWVTVSHVADDAGVGSEWKLRVVDFLGSEFGLLNPVFVIAMVWACFAMWRRGRYNPLLVYFFSMGVPVFLVYFLQSFRYRVLPNWIAPAVLPLFCVMVIYWDSRWRLRVRQVKGWLTAGLALGFTMVILGHNTDLIGKFAGGHLLPVNYDPLHRVREWDRVAQTVGAARQDLLAEGKPVFIIAAHYGLVGEISFYLPEARLKASSTPLVYYRTSATPRNQFYFWPGYQDRKGENAIFVQELDREKPNPRPPPPELQQEFESVNDLGIRNVLYHGHLLRPLQLFACRTLR